MANNKTKLFDWFLPQSMFSGAGLCHTLFLHDG